MLELEGGLEPGLVQVKKLYSGPVSRLELMRQLLIVTGLKKQVLRQQKPQ